MKTVITLLLALSAATALAGGLSPVDEALGHYEAIRASLARDEAAPVAALASKLAATSRQAASESKEDRKALLAIAASAEALAKSSNELAATRLAFADVSRDVLALVAANPELRDGKFVYSCPMVKGYGKWLQEEKAIENPYYGSKMLRCAVAE